MARCQTRDSIVTTITNHSKQVCYDSTWQTVKVDTFKVPVNTVDAPIRGMYVSTQVKIGDIASEEAFLKWCKSKGVNMVNFYARSFLYDSSKRSQLAAFVKKAKEQYGVLAVTVDVRLTDNREYPGWVAYFEKYKGTSSMIEPLAEFEPYSSSMGQSSDVYFASYTDKYAHFFMMLRKMSELTKQYGVKWNWYQGWVGNKYLSGSESDIQKANDSLVKYVDRVFVSNYVSKSDYISTNPSYGAWDNRMDKRLERIALGMAKMRPGAKMDIVEIVSLELKKWGAGNDFLGEVYACPVNTTNMCHSFYGSRYDKAVEEYNKSSANILKYTVLVGRTMFYQKYAVLAQPN
ncbi:MAG: hypothetical protein DWQ44_09020 [Bacteroidetes bacterium]|nr:MAG: hypothetical protein DWQ33_02755 [Bacteroidota bacterium]REK06431.1 MAG: hypothetical protein DWQ39_02810 [Bacteroidota bacterium]REK33197.1 MAG: hypothetical protein DWQ44_09020 [Bacteroidota bacterium]REK47034.1 MAG: hypothetical protein DWQ48_13355 [Bacteroidota bacterium]